MRTPLLLFFLFFISAAELEAQSGTSSYHKPWPASPTIGIRQWDHTSVEIGFSRGMVRGSDKGYSESSGTLNANYFSVALDAAIIKNPVYDVEFGYWRKLGSTGFPNEIFFTIGIHASGYFNANGFLPGISLPEPAINFSSSKTNPVVFQLSYRYQYVSRSESIPGFSSSQLSLVVYRSHNAELIKVY